MEEKLRESEKTKIELQNEIHNINSDYQILKDDLKSENVKSNRYLEELQKWKIENAELGKKLEYKPSSSSAHVQTEEECKEDLIQIKEELVLMKSNLKETKMENCGLSTQVNMKQAEIDKLKKSLEDENLNSARFSNELRNLQEEFDEKLSVAEEKLRESEKTKIELQNEILNINAEYQILKDELKSENVKSNRYLERTTKMGKLKMRN